MALFCKHDYEYMNNPKSPELRGIWMTSEGDVYNKKICKKCYKVKKFAILGDKE